MRTPTPVADPWAPSDVDSGWRDLVVSSSPPPPPNEAFQPMRSPINSTLLADLHTWQEHGAPRTALAPVDEPTFDGDRRLWKAAGALMVLATLVLAALGSLTLGNGRSLESALAPTAIARPLDVAPATPSHVTAPSAASGVAYGPANSPRLLKRTKHTHHHKPIASR
jgi:hypothetical protein